MPIASSYVILVGPLWIAAAVLAGAGIGKLARPAPTLVAVRSLGAFAGRVATTGAVRTLGAVELAAAVAVVWFGGRVPATAVAFIYVVLAGVAWRLRAADSTRGGGHGAVGCGCFGQSAAPVDWTHAMVNGAAATLATVAAVTGSLPGLMSAWPDLPAAGVPHLLLVVAGSMAVVALLTVLPAVRAAASGPPATDPRVHLFGPTIPRRRPA